MEAPILDVVRPEDLRHTNTHELGEMVLQLQALAETIITAQRSSQDINSNVVVVVKHTEVDSNGTSPTSFYLTECSVCYTLSKWCRIKILKNVD